MNKGGPERQFEHMRAAMKSLRKVVDVIDQGEIGATVSMPIKEAALAFRISGDTFQRMEERRQGLGISVVDEMVVIKLYGGETERRKAYQFLYGLTQNSLLGTAEEFLANRETPSSLKEEFPGIEGIVEFVKGGALPEEDLKLLHLHLETLWQSLRDRTDLYDPMKAFSAVSY